jgi:hypothetical protein
MKDANGNILFQAKDGAVTCKTGTFENVTVQGTLNGVTGTFKSLNMHKQWRYGSRRNII